MTSAAFAWQAAERAARCSLLGAGQGGLVDCGADRRLSVFVDDQVQGGHEHHDADEHGEDGDESGVAALVSARCHRDVDDADGRAARAEHGPGDGVAGALFVRVSPGSVHVEVLWS